MAGQRAWGVVSDSPGRVEPGNSRKDASLEPGQRLSKVNIISQVISFDAQRDTLKRDLKFMTLRLSGQESRKVAWVYKEKGRPEGPHSQKLYAD